MVIFMPSGNIHVTLGFLSHRLVTMPVNLSLPLFKKSAPVLSLKLSLTILLISRLEIIFLYDEVIITFRNASILTPLTTYHNSRAPDNHQQFYYTPAYHCTHLRYLFKAMPILCWSKIKPFSFPCVYILPEKKEI